MLVDVAAGVARCDEVGLALLGIGIVIRIDREASLLRRRCRGRGRCRIGTTGRIDAIAGLHQQSRLARRLQLRSPSIAFGPQVVGGPTLLTGLIHCGKCGGAMTIRTGKGGRYRYYTCSMKARQGATACEGMTVPMEKLDDLVAGHLEERLLDPERLEEVLSAVLDRRQERSDRRQEHIAELNKRAAETELRLKRLYDAIESGVADLDDPALKDRIDGLKATRDQARADAERASALLQSSAQQAITPTMLRKFASTARQRIQLDGAATVAIISARSPSGLRLIRAKSASWARRATCCACLPLTA